MTCGIYGIRNDINGKWYIGQSQNVEKRNREEKRNIRRGYIHNSGSGNKYFNSAIKKYGADAFSFHLIEECCCECLNEREKHYIKFYNSMPPNGYNLTEGGTSGTRGYKFTEEQKRKMSEIQKEMVRDGRNKVAGRRGADNPMYGKPSPNRGKRPSDETIKKIVANRRNYEGKKNPNYGKHASEETKLKWHKQRFGRKLSDTWKNNISLSSVAAKPVVCVDNGQWYRSCAEAAIFNQIRTPRNIGDVCNGKLKSCGGKKWKWAKENVDNGR